AGAAPPRPLGGHARAIPLYISTSLLPDGTASGGGRAAPQSEEDDSEDDADDRQNPGDAGGSAGDPGEPEHSGNQRDDKEYDGPAEHDCGLLISMQPVACCNRRATASSQCGQRVSLGAGPTACRMRPKALQKLPSPLTVRTILQRAQRSSDTARHQTAITCMLRSRAAELRRVP